MTTEAKSAKKRSAVRRCPVCGQEAWRIAYGMMMPEVMAEHPKTEFAGCCLTEEVRIHPATGKVESGVPEWACQNPECRHRWW
jgi:hypothetical protein